MNQALLDKIESEQFRKTPVNFSVGDTVRVHTKVVEGDKERGYRVLFGEGDVPWQKVLAAAEAKGGAEYYLIEQEGSRYSSLETAERCLANYKKMRA